MTLSWAKRIASAKKRGYFTKSDVKASHGWCSCAVGEKLGIPHRKDIHKPSLGHDMMTESQFVQRELGLELGNKFYTAVSDNRIDKVEEIYKEIQKIK